LLVNKEFEKINEDDGDKVLEEKVYDYQYVDETTTESAAYIWIEMEVGSVENKQIKDMRIYVTVACHKSFMQLNPSLFRGMIGNRRDNLVRYIDKILNNSNFMGIGALKLDSVRTVAPINGFVMREITYEIPDFNIVDLTG
jgi:hypothetical protein